MTELLVVLALLGQIATFSIAKLVQVQSDARRIAVMRETIGALSEIVYQGWLMKEMSPTNNGTYILDRLNAVKVCRTNAQTEGCWTHADLSGVERTYPGAVLASGATIAGLNNGSDGGPGAWGDAFVVDWNGSKPPNLEGEDQIFLRGCWGAGNCWSGLRPGIVRYRESTPTSQAFFELIFASK